MAGMEVDEVLWKLEDATMSVVRLGRILIEHDCLSLLTASCGRFDIQQLDDSYRLSHCGA